MCVSGEVNRGDRERGNNASNVPQPDFPLSLSLKEHGWISSGTVQVEIIPEANY